MAHFNFGVKKAPTVKIWDELKTHSDGLGGALLDTTELDASKNDGYVMQGCPLYLDLSTKKAHVVKSALVLEGGTTAAPRVSKQQLFKVGDFVYGSGDAVTVNAVDDSNADYDVLTLSVACTGATKGNVINEAAAAGANPKAKYEANVLLLDNTAIIDGENVACIFRIDQWVDESRIVYALSDATKKALAPNIIIK